MSEIYQQQVRGPTVTPLTDAVGPNDASIFGQGLAQLGQTMESNADLARRTKQQVDQIAFETNKLEQERHRAAAYDLSMGAYADFQVGLEQDRAKVWDALPEGKQGFARQFGNVVKERTKGFLDGIPDPEVRGRIVHMVDAYSAQEQMQAIHAETGAFAKFQGQAGEAWTNQTANTVMLKPTADNYLRAVREAHTYADGRFSDVAMRDAFTRITERKVSSALFDGMLNQGDWAGVRKLIESGQFNSILSPDEMDQYSDKAGYAERGAARAAETQVAQAQHDAREAYKSIKVDVDNGGTVPQSSIIGVIEKMKAVGLPQSEIKEAGYLGRDALNQQQIRGLATPVLDAKMQQLRNQQNAGKISDDEKAWLDSADKALDRRAKEGGAKLGPLLRGTTDQQFQAVMQLSQMPLDERFRVARAAGDEKAAVIAGLAPETQVRALQGQALIAARRDDFMPPRGTNTSSIDVLDGQTKQIMGNLVGDSGANYAHIRDSALAVMAGFRAHAGWDAGQFENAVQIVYGRNRRADGTPQGGIGTIRGRKVELPQHWSEAEWDKAYSRNPFSGAINAMGDAISHSDIKANYTPRHMGTLPDGTEEYWMLDAGGKQLLTRQGKTFAPYVLRVPARFDAGGNTPQKPADPYAQFPIVGHADARAWDKRGDGSAKGMGWLGLRKRPDGGVSSEISAGFNIDGKEREIPLMVPGLSGVEVSWLMTKNPKDLKFDNHANGIEKSIMRKAVDFARSRIAQGKSPFRQAGEKSSIDAVNRAESR